MGGVEGATLQRRRGVKLSDRYELREGPVFMTGIQALVRTLLDQSRADRAAGARTAFLASGYPGSPLAGFDRELGALADEHHLHLQPAVNEELGATAVWGSQLAGALPGPRYDGVVGVWYGKAPGLDRAGDAIRHGNFVGTDPRGGVLALVGDDPACKSSTVPGASEASLAALGIPTFAPGSVQEALDLGRHAIACSRASGLWSSLKVVTDVADAVGTVEVGPDRVAPTMPTREWEGRPYVHRPSAHLLAPQSLEMERTLHEVRLELARDYVELNGLSREVAGQPGARLGIVAAGTAAHHVRAALADLGLEPGAAPVRVLQLGALFPLDEAAIRRFAADLDEVLVVEEKRPYLEPLIKDALYAAARRPRVTGRHDDLGRPLRPVHGALDPDSVARMIAARVLAFEEVDSVRARLAALDAVEQRPATAPGATRTPFFCSGCPHNTSTAAPDDEVVGAGIGCHTMVLLSRRGHGAVEGITQMGGEGAQWIGAAPFVEGRHFTQNLGDGTFHHSGSLAIRAAVAAGLDITYKLLYNGTTAMTGGQDVEGMMGVAAVARELADEGVARIAITTEDTSRYRGADLPPIAAVRDRDELLAVGRELAAVEGVTVLIHDQACAAELRRARKRGKAPTPAVSVVINERVCEGCGDCGKKSNCLSVEPVETELGRKTRINQTSCNKDFSCLDGDCPSFITVIPRGDGKSGSGRRGAGGSGRSGSEPRWPVPEPPPAPEPSRAADTRIRLVGIGGTGVVTVNQILGMAALVDGLHSAGLDQTGLSQKAGPVTSDLRISRAADDESAVPPAGSLDLLLGFDLLGAATERTLYAADPERTVAVVSEGVVPTGEMVVDPAAAGIDVAAAKATIRGAVRPDPFFLDAEATATRLFGDATPANVLLVGAALQLGLLPTSLDAVEEAIRLNGTAVERNLDALAWGRIAVAAPDDLAAAIAPPADAPPAPSRRKAELLAEIPALGPELDELLRARVGDLFEWGGDAPARRYLRTVLDLRAREGERVPGSTALTVAVARGLHKLTAYKDEYEVARLHLEGLADLPADAKAYFHLHPPVLRALGMKRKLKLGSWFVPGFRLLRSGRRLRGTPLDPFGHTRVRRVERRLPAEYLELVEAAADALSPATLATAVEIAELPELVRGYEEIKLAGVESFRRRGAALTARMEEA